MGRTTKEKKEKVVVKVCSRIVVTDTGRPYGTSLPTIALAVVLFFDG